MLWAGLRVLTDADWARNSKSSAGGVTKARACKIWVRGLGYH